MHRLVPFVSASAPAAATPSTLLSGLMFELDPARASVASGKIASFGSITQTDDTRRAAYVASHAYFNNQPVASFAPPLASNLPAPAQSYSLPNLAALTQGEVFAVLHPTYGPFKDDPLPATSLTGLWHMGNSNSAAHFPWTDGNWYDYFGTLVRYTYADMSEETYSGMLCYVNIAVNATEVKGVINFINVNIAGHTVGFPSNARFGSTANEGYAYHGLLGYMGFCNQVQTAPARLAMKQYLNTRFAQNW